MESWEGRSFWVRLVVVVLGIGIFPVVVVAMAAILVVLLPAWLIFYLVTGKVDIAGKPEEEEKKEEEIGAIVGVVGRRRLVIGDVVRIGPRGTLDPGTATSSAAGIVGETMEPGTRAKLIGSGVWVKDE